MPGDRSDILPVRDPRIGWLEQLLQRHQASITIDYLYDHGWQVSISNPGGSLFVHGGTPHKPEEWSEGREAALGETIAEAALRAGQEGWWRLQRVAADTQSPHRTRTSSSW
jgi:hypothetical protein